MGRHSPTALPASSMATRWRARSIWANTWEGNGRRRGGTSSGTSNRHFNPNLWTDSQCVGSTLPCNAPKLLSRLVPENGGRIARQMRRISTLLKHLMCTTVLLFGATALRADVFSFSYAGASVSASGTLTATALGLGAYTVTNITGIRNTTSFNTGATGLFYYPTSNP